MADFGMADSPALSVLEGRPREAGEPQSGAVGPTPASAIGRNPRGRVLLR